MKTIFQLSLSWLILLLPKVYPTPVSNSGINWEGDEALGCDFNGHDLVEVPGSRFDCSSKCRQTAQCTHYTWNSFQGGTCWLKWGRGSKDLAFEASDPQSVCGIIQGSIEWQGDWAHSCDFDGVDLDSAQVPADQCSGVCSRTSGCSHYSWSWYNGGTCWLKSGSVSKADAFFSNDFEMVCGIVSGGGGGDVTVSQEQFVSAVVDCGFPAPSWEQYSAFINGVPCSQISSVRELAMFLAQILHESAGLTALREIRCQETGCVGEYLPPGPNGVVYYGRGYMQLTWDYNYRDASADIFGDQSVLLNDPERVAYDQEIAWKTAFWYWKTNVHTVQAVLDGYFGASTNAINGPLECSGGDPSVPRTRFYYYTVVLVRFGVFEAPLEGGCYN